MATINIDSVLKRVDDAMGIKNGKIATINGKLPAKLLSKLSANNQLGIIAGTQDINKASNKLVEEIRLAMPSLNSGGSLADSFSASDFDVSEPRQKDGFVEVEITISETARHRDSLYPKGYPNGADIILLFNDGYNAQRQTYGEWHGEMIHSLTKRSASHFLQKAVTSFNAKYSTVYGCRAIVNSEYK